MSQVVARRRRRQATIEQRRKRRLAPKTSTAAVQGFAGKLSKTARRSGAGK